MKTEILVNARRFDSSFYKAFRFQSVEHAREIVGENPYMRVYKNKKEYIDSGNDSASEKAWRKVRADRVSDGVPMAVNSLFSTHCSELNESKFFVYGVFPDYHGRDSQRWEVLSIEELSGYITIDEAEDVLHGKRN